MSENFYSTQNYIPQSYSQGGDYDFINTVRSSGTQREQLKKVAKEFEAILTMIILYLDYVESYINLKREKVKGFLVRKNIYGVDHPTDFDGLNVLIWRFFRDYFAFNYACKQLAWRYRRLGKDVKDTLLALYFSLCINQLNKFTF